MSLTVVIITRREPLFTPDYLRPLMDSPLVRIEHIFFDERKSPHLKTVEIIRLCSIKGFFRLCLLTVLSKIPGGLKLAGFEGDRDIALMAGKRGIPVSSFKSAKEAHFVSALERIRPDLLLSIANSKILPREILATAKIAALNSHGSMLPKYRGILTGFWMLLEGESTGGVTIHAMDADVDSGPILMQESIPIEPDETVFSYYRKVAVRGGHLWRKAVEAVGGGARPAIPNPQDGARVYLKPSLDDMARFRKMGKRFI